MAMIESRSGNLFEAQVEALVNAVNTVGVMGKGIALQFKKAFPQNYAIYKKACDAGEVVIGQMHVVPVSELGGTKYIVNFPTKEHWRTQSRMEHIEMGLASLVKEVKERKIGSIAIPALGCGNGGLAWSKVRPRIEAAFAAAPDVRVLLYEPSA